MEDKLPDRIFEDLKMFYYPYENTREDLTRYLTEHGVIVVKNVPIMTLFDMIMQVLLDQHKKNSSS